MVRTGSPVQFWSSAPGERPVEHSSTGRSYGYRERRNDSDIMDVEYTLLKK